MNRKPLLASIGGGVVTLFIILAGAKRGRDLRKISGEFLAWLKATNVKANTSPDDVKPHVLSVLSAYDNGRFDTLESLSEFRDLVTDPAHRHTLVNAFNEVDGPSLTPAQRAYLTDGKRTYVRSAIGRRDKVDILELPDATPGGASATSASTTDAQH